MSLSTSDDIMSLDNTFGGVFEHVEDEEIDHEREDFLQLPIHSPSMIE